MVKKFLTAILSLALCVGFVFPAAACKDPSASGNGGNTEQTPGGSQSGNGGSQSGGNQGGSGGQGSSGNQGGAGSEQEKPGVGDEPGSGGDVTPGGNEGEVGDHTHEYGAWKVVKEATCREMGERKRTCKICDNAQTESIPKSDHAYNQDNACKFCGRELEYTIGLEYDGNKVVGIGTAKDRDIVIPAYHAGVRITAIGAKAFYGSDVITSVYFPCSVSAEKESSQGAGVVMGATGGAEVVKATVGEAAFSWCENLKSVTFAGILSSVGKESFAHCKKLESVSLNAVDAIGESAFLECTSLTKIELPNEGIKIEREAFQDTGYAQAKSNWEGGLLYIGNHLIAHNADFQQPTFLLKKSVVSIARGALSGAEIDELTIPDDAELQILWADEFPTQIKKVTCPAAYLEIVTHLPQCEELITKGEVNVYVGIFVGELSFKNCMNLKKVTFRAPSRIAGSPFSDCSALEEVIFEEGCSGISEKAFQNCTKIKELHIPGSMKYIRASAFAGCTSLSKLTFGNTTDCAELKIGDYAFQNCSNLTEVSVPENVTEIGCGAFEGCERLQSIVLPFAGYAKNPAEASHKTVFGYIFGYTKLDKQPETLYDGEISSSNRVGYKNTEDGAVYQGYLKDADDKDGASRNFAYRIPQALSSIKITGGCVLKNTFFNLQIPLDIAIGADATTIGAQAFEFCGTLNKIDFPSNITTIEKEAFECCSALTSIEIPKTVTKIESAAFQYCKALKDIAIADEGISIGENAFYNTAYFENEQNWKDGVLYIGNHLILTKYTLSGQFQIKDGTKSIADFAFSGRKTITSVFVPDSVAVIGNSALYGCVGLESIFLGNGVKTIGNSAFYACTAEIKWGDHPSIAELKGERHKNNYNSDKYDYASPFMGYAGKSVVIPGSVIEIGEYAFYGCKSPECIISDGVKTIGDEAFRDCTALTSITIPNSVTEIEMYAFYGCTSLASVTIPNSVTEIESNAFGGCSSLMNITIPDGVKTIGEYAFYGCTSLASVTIPDSVTTIGGSAFDGCTSLASVTIPSSVTEIDVAAFKGCTSLENIQIPSSVTSIGPAAFSGCTALKSIAIPNSVTKIEGGAFDGCTSLTSVAIPDSVTSIGPSAFSGCTALKSIEIPESVKKICDWAFSGCSSLTDIKISDGVEEIGQSAFSGTGFYSDESNWASGVLYIDSFLIKAKKDISGEYLIKSGTIAIADYAFNECKSLTKVVIPESVAIIGINAFCKCTALAQITIPNSVKKIGWGAFSDTAYLNDENNYEGDAIYLGSRLIAVRKVISDEFTIKEGTTEICAGAFSSCSHLTGVVIPNTVTTIESKAFSDCSSLKEVIIPNGVKKIGEDAFYGCSSLKSVVIGDGVTEIGDGAFERCENLKSITIGKSVKTIGSGAFRNCTHLENIEIPESVISLGSSAFSGCKSLTSVIIPNGVTEIQQYTFNICNALKSVTLGNAVTKIGDYAFSECRDLESLIIPQSVTSIGSRAFNYNTLNTITYQGTKEQWKKIEKNSDWKGFFTTFEKVICSDGELTGEEIG